MTSSPPPPASSHRPADDSTAIDPRLAADIALLTGVLDDAVRELAGDDALGVVRDMRAAAHALRADDGDRDAFAARFAALDLDRIELVARASTLWFHLVNAAEVQHRIRVLRERDTESGQPHGSVADGSGELARAGYDGETMQAVLDRIFVMPVITAHPTEARRRTVLDHLAVIGEVLDALDRRTLGASERLQVLATLRHTVLALFGTEESRAHKPTPVDELQSSLDVFDTTLLDATVAVYRALEDALARRFPDRALAVPVFLRWGTWVGGDRDGNPFVTADTTRMVFEKQRTLVLARYLHDVDELMRELSIAAERVGRTQGLAALEASLGLDRERLPEIEARTRRYTTREPWREKLWYIRERLRATVTRDEAAYPGAASYTDDLRLLSDSLRGCGYGRLADGTLRDAIRRAEVFGFHLATLDLRQHSDVHERVVAEILATSAGVAGYRDMDEEARCRILEEALERADFALPVAPHGRRSAELSAETREIIATLDMVGRARRELGPDACERYIVSFTRSVSDLLEVLFLIRAARLSPGELRPVPLLEQLEDLDRAGPIASAMLDSRPIRAALGGELEVMIGYSDAGKQIGYFASAVALRRAQLALADVAEQRGVVLTIFHGRGGAIGRGGGPASQTVRAQPCRALGGRIRVTEQGETVTTRYGRAEIARRDLEQMISAVLVSTADERTVIDPDELAERSQLLDTAAAAARERYAALLADPDRLARYALAATPIRQVTKLPIGSRPASRKPGLSFDDLRAIPWVFSWNQSRHGLPGWFGLGSALETIIRAHGVERARALYESSPFFRALIDNAQLALGRADIDVARQYSLLADDDARTIFELIEDEYRRTVRHLLDVVARTGVLDDRPHISAAVRRRNPIVDVLSHAQIELLRRLAAADPSQHERILTTLFITINGIAAGLQTAG